MIDASNLPDNPVARAYYIFSGIYYRTDKFGSYKDTLTDKFGNIWEVWSIFHENGFNDRPRVKVVLRCKEVNLTCNQGFNKHHFVVGDKTCLTCFDIIKGHYTHLNGEYFHTLEYSKWNEEVVHESALWIKRIVNNYSNSYSTQYILNDMGDVLSLVEYINDNYVKKNNSEKDCSEKIPVERTTSGRVYPKENLYEKFYKAFDEIEGFIRSFSANEDKKISSERDNSERDSSKKDNSEKDNPKTESKVESKADFRAEFPYLNTILSRDEIVKNFKETEKTAISTEKTAISKEEIEKTVISKEVEATSNPRVCSVCIPKRISKCWGTDSVTSLNTKLNEVIEAVNDISDYLVHLNEKIMDN